MPVPDEETVNLLVVVQWPLGGIRTYMKYVYRYFPARYRITLLVSSTHEDAALAQDATEIGARLVVCDSQKGTAVLTREVFRQLSRSRYDVIQSQGFISALAVYPVNLLFRVPHILTVHGIVEEKYFCGRLAWLKKSFLLHVIKMVDTLYAVSNDMLDHLYQNVPSLPDARCKKVVIPNGIDVSRFVEMQCQAHGLRERLGIDKDTFLYGFLGRFMQQKGFNYLVDAIEIIEQDTAGTRRYALLAVGSGDYLEYYQRVVRERNLGSRFHFIPFQSDITAIYNVLDAVVMPSIWEACPLLPMETLCMGVPLIASDCIGLRETVAGTPAVVFPSKDVKALAGALQSVMEEPKKDLFRAFVPEAVRMYDVANTAGKLTRLIDGMLHEKR